MRVFLSPISITLIDLVILIPLALGIFTVTRDLWAAPHLEHTLDILEGMGVILIGWGVAVEERRSLREIFHLSHPDAARDDAIDTVCHTSGIGLLIFGLFAEIAVEAVRLPNDIVYTQGFDEVVAWISLLFLALGAVVLIHHIGALVGAAFLGIRPAPHPSSGTH